MPNQHKNPGISWHSSDPTLKAWIEAEAVRRGTTKRAVLDEMAGEYRERVEFLKGLAGKEIRHLDGDPLNNDLDNLELRERQS